MVRISKEALRRAMIANGVDVSTLAQGSNIHVSNVSKLLNHGGGSRYSTAFKLATTLNVSPFDLIEESGTDDDDDRHIYRAGKATGKRKGR